MTYETWWEQFSSEYDEWRYADSNALRKAAFEAGQESLRQQLATALAACKVKDAALDKACITIEEVWQKSTRQSEEAMSSTKDVWDAIDAAIGESK